MTRHGSLTYASQNAKFATPDGLDPHCAPDDLVSSITAKF
jgi:hypothetical protein